MIVEFPDQQQFTIEIPYLPRSYDPIKFKNDAEIALKYPDVFSNASRASDWIRLGESNFGSLIELAKQFFDFYQRTHLETSAIAKYLAHYSGKDPQTIHWQNLHDFLEVKAIQNSDLHFGLTFEPRYRSYIADMFQAKNQIVNGLRWSLLTGHYVAFWRISENEGQLVDSAIWVEEGGFDLLNDPTDHATANLMIAERSWFKNSTFANKQGKPQNENKQIILLKALELLHNNVFAASDLAYKLEDFSKQACITATKSNTIKSWLSQQPEFYRHQNYKR